MTGESYDEILDAVLEASESGAKSSIEELLARFPGQEANIRKALESFDAYRRLRSAAAGAGSAGSDELVAGDRLGDFEIVDRLASGGMGVVYRARQLSLGRRIVALKVLANDRAGQHGVLRFQREALQLAGLHHPHLAEVYGFGEERGMLFLAMRLVEGANLRDVLEQRAVDRATGHDRRETRLVVERIAEVADALALAHARGLVHRDVKPSNIVLEGGDRAESLHSGAVLVDFGLARPVDERVLTLTGASPATPSYAPPEQLLGQPVDARADVFSLGVTLHDLLSARRPTERMQASAGMEPLRELARDVDADLAAIVARAVDPEARWRYADAAAVRNDLRGWLAGEPVSARSLPWRERAVRSLSRNPRRIARAMVVAVACVVAVVALSVGPGAELQSVSRARERYERGDLREFARAAHDISSLTTKLVGRGDAFGRALERVRSASASDPLRRVLGSLEENDTSSALVKAVTALGAEPETDHELLERFLLACEFDESLRARVRERDVDTWTIFMARLFYERPIESLEEFERSAPYREAVLSAFRRNELSPTARNFVVSALGGVGRTEDAPGLLLESIADPSTPFERVRIHLHNATRILRRARRLGLATSTPFDAYWKALAPVVERLRELDWDSRSYAGHSELIAIVTDLALTQRAAGLPLPALTRWPPSNARIALDRAVVTNLDGWALPLAAAEDPWFIAHISGPGFDAFASTQSARELGQLAALLNGRPDLEARCRERAGLVGEQGWRAAYDDGVARSLAALRGEHAEELLDADTRLGWRPASYDLTPLPGQRSAAENAPRLEWPELKQLPADENASMAALLATLPLHSLSVLEFLEPDAVWWVREGEARWCGAAHAPRGIATTLDHQGGKHFTRMHAFGTSELELAFDVDSNSLGLRRVLVLSLQSNGRNGYPNLGEAHLQVLLNETELATTSAIRNDGTRVPIALPISMVYAGVNRVRLRLLATSTTPLRVHDARVVTLRP